MTVKVIQSLGMVLFDKSYTFSFYVLYCTVSNILSLLYTLTSKHFELSFRELVVRLRLVSRHWVSTAFSGVTCRVQCWMLNADCCFGRGLVVAASDGVSGFSLCRVNAAFYHQFCCVLELVTGWMDSYPWPCWWASVPRYF